VYGDIAVNYYVFVALFAAYAFSSRRAVAVHVAFAAAASALPLFYRSPQASLAGARTVVDVLLLVVIAGVVTLLREGLQTRQRELQELALRDPLTGV
jgi:RsiW-degrading membrane proteinase PrsW (M82 family)